MKKAMAMLSVCLLLSGCASNGNDVSISEPEPVINSEQYIKNGRYYTDGTVITSDGNVWGYQTETISDKPVYDDEPVYVVFDDNATETIYDDAIIGLVLDMETAIYDKLETELSSSFELERDGNNIRLTRQK